MARRDDQRDWFGLVLAVINPLLVMGLVGSLAFFLIDVLYRGLFEGRLRWTMFFFVFGAVLASRVALVLGSERGWIYGLVLGGVTYVAALRFAGGLGWLWNLLIIAVTAGSAYALTRDSTWLPDEPADRGHGLADEFSASWQLLPEADGTPRPRRHGLWVVGFSLAALPLFGLGESLIPAEDKMRQVAANRLMTVYVASGLGLLLTTALVSFRERLRTRRLRMPAGLAVLWLGSGLAIIAAAIVVGMLMPRPGPGPNWVRDWAANSTSPSASPLAANAETAGTGRGHPGSKNENVAAKSDTANSKRGNPDLTAKSKSDVGRQGEKGREFSKKSTDDRGSDEGSGSSDVTPATRPIQILADIVQRVTRWLLIALLVGLAVLFALRRVSTWNQTVRQWYTKLLGWLGRLVGREELHDQTDDAIPEQVRTLPVTYSNPFVGGADGRETAELVALSFAALAAWAERRGSPRQTGETPYEFAERVEADEPELAGPVAELARHYSAVAYTVGRRVPESARADVEAFWSAFEPFNNRASSSRDAEE